MATATGKQYDGCGVPGLKPLVCLKQRQLSRVVDNAFLFSGSFLVSLWQSAGALAREEADSVD